MRKEIESLQKTVRDLEIELLTSNEHGDYLEEHLYRTGISLAAEVRERQATEEKLRKLVATVTREKGDLEILVQILNEQGDLSAEDSEKARIDSLTQIANRRRFDEYLLAEWAHHARLREPLTLLICDVDHFKFYNDHYGHRSGDECLKRVAAAISECVRPGDLVARYGGEEFAIILRQVRQEDAVAVAERARSSVESACVPHARSPICDHVTLSVGLASQTPPTSNATDAYRLVEAADRNLYLAKKGGRNRVNH